MNFHGKGFAIQNCPGLYLHDYGQEEKRIAGDGIVMSKESSIECPKDRVLSAGVAVKATKATTCHHDCYLC